MPVLEHTITVMRSCIFVVAGGVLMDAGARTLSVL